MDWRFASSGSQLSWRYLCAAALAALLPNAVYAQTWDGAGVAGGVVTWSTAANWNPDGVPVNNGTANIIMAGTLDTSNTFDVNFDINSLTFNNTAGAFVITNGVGAVLTIRAGGITDNDSQTQTISGPITLGASQTWNAVAGDLSYAAVNLNGNQLTLAGANDHNFSGQLTGATGSVIKNGSGIAIFGANGTSYAGTFTLNAGTVQLIGGVDPLGTGALTLNGGSIDVTIPKTLANALTLGGNFTTSGSADLNLSAAATLTGDRTITTNNAGLTTFSGSIGQNAAGRSLAKSGTGTLRFSGAAANTYTGNTNVNAGTLILAKTAGLNAVAGGALVIGDGAGIDTVDVRLEASNQILDTTSVTIHTDGLLNLNGFAESLQLLQLFGGGVGTGAGTLTVTSQIFHESAFNDTSSMTGNLGLGDGTVTFNVEDGTPGVDLAIDSAISNGGVLKTGAGLLRFSGGAPNTYVGVTTVDDGELVLDKADNVVAVAGDLAIDAGTVTVSSDGQFAAATDVAISSFGLLSVANNNSIASLTLSDGVVATSSAPLTVSGPISVNNTASNSSFIQGNGTLLLTGSGNSISVADGAAIHDLEIFPAINSTTGLTKTGPGRLLLNGNAANSITGTTTINEGTLQLAKSLPNVTALGGNIVVGDGLGGPDADILRLGQNHQIAQLVTETVTVNSSGLFDLNGQPEVIGNLQLNAGRVAGGSIGFTGAVTTSAQSTQAEIGSNVDLLGSTTVFTVNDGAAINDLFMNGTVENGSFTKSGLGTLKLAGATANTATLSQLAAGTVILEKDPGMNALGGSQVTISDAAGPAQGDVLRYGAFDHQLPDSMHVVVQSSGLLDLNGRSDTIGTVTISGSGVVQTGAGTLTVASQVVSSLDTSAGTINGNLNLNGGIRPFVIANSVVPPIDLTVAAAMSNGTLQKQGAGTLALTGSALSSAASYQLDDGTLSASGLNVAASQSFTQNAGTFSGTLNNHGAFTYNAGTFNGQLVNKPTGTTSFNADFTALLGLTNEGFIAIPAGRTVTANGAGILNDGTIALEGGTLAASSTSNFTNDELIQGHGLISASSVNFVNVGDVVVSGGDLAIDSNFSKLNEGIIVVPNNLKLQLLGAGNMQNTGLVFLDGGKITGPAGLTNNLGGEIRGGSSVETQLTNAGGLIRASGAGTLVITNLTGNTAGGELRVDDGATMNVQNSFSTSGTIVLAGTNATFSGGTITNTGTIRGLGRVNNVVTNTGTIRAENGTLTLAAAGHTNTASGRIEAGAGVQVLYSQGLAANSGQIALTGGAFDNNNVALANSGRIEGYGTLRTGGLTNTGTISIGGSLDVLGAVAQNATVSTQTGTTVRFFGPVSGPGSYPGAGTVMFLNTFSPGASPAEVIFGGNVIFTGSNNLISRP